MTRLRHSLTGPNWIHSRKNTEATVAHDGSDTPSRVWFPTDNLVIRAGNKIFRVSGAILAARSSVFSDKIAFPQPASGYIEQIDGCPVWSTMGEEEDEEDEDEDDDE
ncbi:hypothetical protein B0H13DRAFT_1876666 [Mycena leptocephala]|nr:hypothetical protein B0H13DRAFT_1876666 [Mycena leptocephala]